MTNDVLLTEDEQDCLQELMNVAYGAATAAISEILDAYATLSIPKIEIIDVHDLKSYLNKSFNTLTPHYVSTQLINGKISGENLFVINKDSAINLAKEFDLYEEDLRDEELNDVLLEITNILSSSTISTLASQMETIVSFSPPNVKLVDSINDLDNKFINKYKKVIIISTELNFTEQNIKGELLILTTDHSISYIKDILNKLLEEF